MALYDDEKMGQARIDYEQEKCEKYGDVDMISDMASFLSDLGYKVGKMSRKEILDNYYRETEL